MFQIVLSVASLVEPGAVDLRLLARYDRGPTDIQTIDLSAQPGTTAAAAFESDFWGLFDFEMMTRFAAGFQARRKRAVAALAPGC